MISVNGGGGFQIGFLTRSPTDPTPAAGRRLISLRDRASGQVDVELSRCGPQHARLFIDGRGVLSG